MGVAKAAGDAMLIEKALAQACIFVVALEACDAIRRLVGNDIATYGRRLGASFGGTLGWSHRVTGGLPDCVR
jgi:hypothetical protein